MKIEDSPLGVGGRAPLFEHFDALADAPGGVAKLRELILQLAVQGRLVEQDTNDEPIESLLAHIDQQRKGLQIRLINMQGSDAEEALFEIPRSWRWVKLGTITHNCGQKVPDKLFTYIDVSSIDRERGRISEELKTIRPEDAPSRARKLVAKGTVIYSTVRPYLLNIAVVDREYEPEPLVSTAFAVLHPFDGVSDRFLYYYLRSKPFIDFVSAAMTGVAYPAINDSRLQEAPVPLPPLAEQKRIVAKVDQLMVLCDELEAKQQQRDAARAHAHQASLTRLLLAQGPADFAAQWSRLRDHFDVLHDTPASVAVQGKLVEQDERDEPAEYFLSASVQKLQLSMTKNGHLSSQRDGNG